ncbi:MAG: hypothetical protein HOP35_02865 [Nitrospira sp.]|nr:hypothetical protein [Nitrospira sp.]
MANTIFYSWQSDSSPKVNRIFIRECLLRVLKKLNKDLDIQDAIRLDHDTAGIPGTPDVANVIFGKIREAGVVVADLTLCSTSDENKRSPNPNVLIELGYAFSAISDARVVGVMNTAFGTAQELPFDLAHKRWPVRYSLTDVDLEDKEKKEKEREKLTNDLFTAIRLVLHAASEPSPALPRLSGTPSLTYIEQTILHSDPQEGWECVSNGVSSVRINKTDVNLRLEMTYADGGIQREFFKADWANRHPDPSATGYWCDIYYGSTQVFRTILVSVDGGRALLPVPRQQGVEGKMTEVLLYDYRIAQLFDSLGTVDEYMRRSGLSIAFR